MNEQVTITKEEHISASIELMKRARDHLDAAGSTRAADAARKALRSAEGAKRHAIAQKAEATA